MSVYGVNEDDHPWDYGLRQNARKIREYREARARWLFYRKKFFLEARERRMFTGGGRVSSALNHYMSARNALLDAARFYPYNLTIIKKYP